MSSRWLSQIYSRVGEAADEGRRGVRGDRGEGRARGREASKSEWFWNYCEPGGRLKRQLTAPFYPANNLLAEFTNCRKRCPTSAAASGNVSASAVPTRWWFNLCRASTGRQGGETFRFGSDLRWGVVWRDPCEIISLLSLRKKQPIRACVAICILIDWWTNQSENVME